MIDALHTTADICVCNRAITAEIYYAIEPPDEPRYYLGHWACLSEFGWLPDDGPMGISHDTCD